ncbi:hypothetical protein ARMGADRAFT_774114 [Armillaria gallica]|uniref:Uncharacterized protein n=1 Tax=Armillaria gallica TaxID=47427 RepID=A0A2H3CFB8_ARMGA|nr:hypothetical protein ARMGADRAFT_774114 [Armillaria gallica]
MDLEQLDQALDFFMKQRHPNLPQIFGVCRSPDLPAIIFHGTRRIPFDNYLRNLPVEQFVQFFSELIQDLESISEALASCTSQHSSAFSMVAKEFLCVIIVLMDRELQPFYFNEHGKLVFGDLLCETLHRMEVFKSSYVLPADYGKFHIPHSRDVRPSTELHHGQVSGCVSSSSRERDLLNLYKAIIFCQPRNINMQLSWTQTFNCHRLQPPQYQLNCRFDSVYSAPYQRTLYAPGSILTDPPSLQVPSTLVGRIPPWLRQWKWDVYLRNKPLRGVVNLSFVNGSVSIELSWDDVSRNAAIGIQSRLGEEMFQSWIAQTSKLHSQCLDSRGYGVNLGAYIITGGQLLVQLNNC